MFKKGEKLQIAGVNIAGYIWFFIAILFFSGIFREAQNALKLLDLSTYLGQFGTIIEGAAPGFAGKGGSGLRDMFVQVITIAPGVFFTVALVEVVEHYGGMKAAGKILTPVLKIFMGVPGESSIAIIANWQSSDGSAAIVKAMYDNKTINSDQRSILTAYIIPGAALIGMMISYGVVLYPYLLCSSGLIIVIVTLMKFVGANMMRFYIKLSNKKICQLQNRR